jgi:hypothetical protein
VTGHIGYELRCAGRIFISFNHGDVCDSGICGDSGRPPGELFSPWRGIARGPAIHRDAPPAVFQCRPIVVRILSPGLIGYELVRAFKISLVRAITPETGQIRAEGEVISCARRVGTAEGRVCATQPHYAALSRQQDGRDDAAYRGRNCDPQGAGIEVARVAAGYILAGGTKKLPSPGRRGSAFSSSERF